MKKYIRPLDIKNGHVDMSHGAGGRATSQLIRELFVAHLGNDLLAQGDDGTILPALPEGARWVMTTDGHVVSPIFFQGGDIGSLAVHGTVNDLAVMGAHPLYLSVSFILEEGLSLAVLDKVVRSMGAAARAANVQIVCGDTKVVERGKGDQIFISTSGVGVVPTGRVTPSGSRAVAGDAVLVSGYLGDHGIAIMAQRESLGFDIEVQSDSASLHTLVEAIYASGAIIHTLRDITRGGLSATLNEIAQQSHVGVRLQEAALPIRANVQAACEIMGLDALNVANEGKLLCLVRANDTEKVLAAMRAHPLGGAAAQVGTVVADEHQFVTMTTHLGGQRVVDWLSAEQLPRIC